MKAHHWGGALVVLVVGGVIGYFIGKNAATPATTPATPAPAATH